MVQSIGAVLQQWAEMDIFYYAIPFLLIFALVFAILQKVNIMGTKDPNASRGVNAIIALSVGLLALQYDKVPIFFSIIFPNLGLGLSILLASLILLGLFIDYTKYRGAAYLFLGIGGVVLIMVLLSSLSDYSWWTGSFWQNNISAIVAGIIIVAFIVVVVNSGKSAEHKGLFLPISGG